MKKVGISEMKTSWGGENISFEPRRFMFEDSVQMISSKYKDVSEEEYADESQVILKIVNGLRELEWEINKQTKKINTNSIIRMLKGICGLDRFYIYIFGDDDIIEQQVEYIRDKNISQLICEALNWESPQNIKIFCK